MPLGTVTSNIALLVYISLCKVFSNSQFYAPYVVSFADYFFYFYFLKQIGFYKQITFIYFQTNKVVP